MVDNRSARLRMSLLGAVAVALFAALVARVWFLQVMSEQEFVAQAEGNRSEPSRSSRPAGGSSTSKGRILVDNRPSIIVTIDKETIATELDRDERDELFFRLAQEISATGKLTKVAEIETRVSTATSSARSPRCPWYATSRRELQQYLAERSFDFPGVNTDVVTVRDYPYGNLAAHLLGYVGALSAEEEEAVRNRPSTYLANDEIGKSGVELFFEDQLRGTPGSRTIEVDKFSNVLDELEVVNPVAGAMCSSRSTSRFRAWPRKSCERGLELARLQAPQVVEDGPRSRSSAPAGAVVILDPRDGSVRAMASYPTFDPGSFVNGISQQRSET